MNSLENDVLHSTLRLDGDVEIAFQRQELAQPTADEIVVEMQAAPMNPTDMFLLSALGDVGSATRVERNGENITLLRAPEWAVAALASRVNKPVAIGSEGAG